MAIYYSIKIGDVFINKTNPQAAYLIVSFDEKLIKMYNFHLKRIQNYSFKSLFYITDWKKI